MLRIPKHFLEPLMRRLMDEGTGVCILKECDLIADHIELAALLTLTSLNC